MSIGLHRLLIWSLNAIEPSEGEPLVLRWLRSLAEHPVRGPLGMALLALGLAALLRAASNRAVRA